MKYPKVSVHYGKAKPAAPGTLTKRCGVCEHYSNGTCAIVIGTVKPGDVCDRFRPKSSS